MMTLSTTPQVYVGTYHKYNSGSIDGAWIELEKFGDKDEFLEACAELHSDEDDPEFMFQDFEGIPDGMISESHIDAEVWEWIELDDDDRELLAVYVEHFDQLETVRDTFEAARDRFQGTHRSPTEWAEQYAEDTGMLERIPEDLRYYFDFEHFARDCQLGGDVTFVEHDGETWVFDNH